jgi:putative FmdB family regulatory protein
MPIYTYRCENCGVQFERSQKFSDQPLTRCPECHKKALRKVYTPVGIVFKGSGFYATDHRSPSGASYSADHNHAEKKPSEEPGTTTEKAVVSEKSTSSDTKGGASGSSSNGDWVKRYCMNFCLISGRAQIPLILSHRIRQLFFEGDIVVKSKKSQKKKTSINWQQVILAVIAIVMIISMLISMAVFH